MGNAKGAQSRQDEDGHFPGKRMGHQHSKNRRDLRAGNVLTGSIPKSQMIRSETTTMEVIFINFSLSGLKSRYFKLRESISIQENLVSNYPNTLNHTHKPCRRKSRLF